jgi:hypothetical protein
MPREEHRAHPAAAEARDERQFTEVRPECTETLRDAAAPQQEMRAVA